MDGTRTREGNRAFLTRCAECLSLFSKHSSFKRPTGIPLKFSRSLIRVLERLPDGSCQDQLSIVDFSSASWRLPWCHEFFPLRAADDDPGYRSKFPMLIRVLNSTQTCVRTWPAVCWAVTPSL